MHQYRSHTCGQLRKSDAGSMVRLSGWIHNRRDLGGMLFLDLRDHYGVTQLFVPKEAAFLDEISRLPKETVIRIDGKVVSREGNINDKMATGEIEVVVQSYEILGPMHGSEEFEGRLPFSVFPEDDTPEETRLRFRFVDLRRSKLHANIVLRSRVISSIRRRMTDMGFLEYSTPILTSSSPEGARDYLVPSRIHPGKFYALPQAPQQFKQLLMVSGFDRYFQIAPCFRDEDARADRSPGEFYQLDLEMSFVTQDDVFAAMETLFTGLYPEFRSDCKVSSAPFQRIPYAESMLKYGSDKPDLRVPLEIRDATELLGNGAVPFMQGKTVRALAVPGCADKPRKFFDTLDARAKSEGLGGLAYVTLQGDGSVKGSVAKFITPEIQPKLTALCNAAVGHAVFLASDADAIKVAKVLGNIRKDLGHELGLAAKNEFRFCWIVDFPMFELDDEGKVAFSHNPFSMPQGGLEALNTRDPLTIKAFQYDLVCNGVELSSGAIRNHRPDVMYRAFEIAGYTQDDVNKRFGGMINAFKLGAPPHGGIAPGVDRIVAMLAEAPNLREVIAFPMNQRAQDLMMGAPSEVTERQLKELRIRIVEE